MAVVGGRQALPDAERRQALAELDPTTLAVVRTYYGPTARGRSTRRSVADDAGHLYYRPD